MRMSITIPKMLNVASALAGFLAFAVLMTENKHDDGMGSSLAVFTLSGAYLFIVSVVLAAVFYWASQWFALGKVEIDADEDRRSSGSLFSAALGFGVMALMSFMDGKWLIFSISLGPVIAFTGLGVIMLASFQEDPTDARNGLRDHSV